MTTTTLRPVTPGDAAALATIHAASRTGMARWEPTRPEAFYTPDGQSTVIAAAVAGMAAGDRWSGVIEADGAVAGQVHLNNILRGPLRSCFVGYWVDQAFRGRGIASAALTLALQVAFYDLALHRVDAFAQPANVASLAVLRRNGFTEIGRAPRHIHIAGRWQDELLFQRLADWDDGVTFEP
jgi:ribosomal-protein-alanine N-acetyltransferase